MKFVIFFILIVFISSIIAEESDGSSTSPILSTTENASPSSTTGSPGDSTDEKRKLICSQDRRDGSPCSGVKSEQKFYYDRESKKCKEFLYTGCLGNDNNFNSRDECQQLCADF